VAVVAFVVMAKPSFSLSTSGRADIGTLRAGRADATPSTVGGVGSRAWLTQVGVRRQLRLTDENMEGTTPPRTTTRPNP